jgi:hypothetical protein
MKISTQKIHMSLKTKLFPLFAFERNDKYLKLNISSLFWEFGCNEVIFLGEHFDKSAFFSSI